MASAIGVVGSVITIFSFLQDMFPEPDNPSAKFAFKIGLDGAGDPPLSNAAGNIPDVRCWNEQGGLLGIITNDNKCENGADLCETSVSDVVQQPTYALFTGNDDAICISWASVTFPGGQTYANTIGNWAQSCDDAYGRDDNWYYSDIYVPTESGPDETVFCAWVDKNGDIDTTGIQLHRSEYAKDAGTKDLDYYCNNDPVLRFTETPDPSDVVYWTRKRDLFSRQPSASRAKHTASGLCGAGKSVGPSFVSLEERMFCYMPAKTVYPFCEDVEEGGACWSEDDEKVVAKGSAGRIAAVPEMKFDKVLHWGEQ
ncbi:hypothetical protein C8035_v006802 [Colletotrichum spinosum]|uniref:Uncharacterized protein n=1 Tax=Colletotrichum spinosum TaxID=1347390 RepID=A0A4R8QJH7_9PEZI|nr:hypothetical protein C8035_v006802 [Colletotrichum spinosum]